MPPTTGPARPARRAIGSLGGRLNDATTTLGKLAYVVAKRDLVAQNLQAARTLQDKEQNRRDAQDLAGNDFSRIELDTQALELELARADADVAVAIATCSATLFAPCSPAGLDAAVLDAAAPLPEALPQPEAAIADRPAHQAQRLEASALGQDAVLADHRKIPDPTVGVTYTYDNLRAATCRSRSWCRSGSRCRSSIAATTTPPRRARTRDRSARRNRRRFASKRGVVDALVEQATTRSRRRSRGSSTTRCRSRRLIVVNTRKAFDGGQSGLADLLLAERQYRDLQSQALDTRFDLFNVARRAAPVARPRRSGRARGRQAAMNDEAPRQLPSARTGNGRVAAGVVMVCSVGLAAVAVFAAPRLQAPRADARSAAAGPDDEKRSEDGHDLADARTDRAAVVGDRGRDAERTRAALDRADSRARRVRRVADVAPRRAARRSRQRRVRRARPGGEGRRAAVLGVEPEPRGSDVGREARRGRARDRAQELQPHQGRGQRAGAARQGSRHRAAEARPVERRAAPRAAKSLVATRQRRPGGPRRSP